MLEEEMAEEPDEEKDAQYLQDKTTENLKMRSYPEREPENKNLFEVGTENKEKDSEV